jgi:hypothetical protein
MDETARRPASRTAPGLSPSRKALAVVLLVVPILGMAAHLAIWLWARNWIEPYCHTHATYAVALLASINFMAALLLGRRTKSRALLAARVLSIMWMVSLALLISSYVRAAVDQ